MTLMLQGGHLGEVVFVELPEQNGSVSNSGECEGHK